jgi:hypothetical protein
MLSRIREISTVFLDLEAPLLPITLQRDVDNPALCELFKSLLTQFDA